MYAKYVMKYFDWETVYKDTQPENRWNCEQSLFSILVIAVTQESDLLPYSKFDVTHPSSPS